MSRVLRLAVAGLLLFAAGGCAGPGTEALPPSSPTPAPADSSTSSSPPEVPVDETPDRWRPPPLVTWQYQLSGRLDLSVDADVYDVDWEETTAEQVQALHDAGRRVVCYVNAGAFEEWRPDAGDYPDDVLGAPLDDWPGERWVDIRRTDVLLPLLAARMDVCAEKGFDAVEADNVDGYDNDTGLDLTADDQLAFNTAVAGLARDRGLSIGLKNDVEQVAALEPVFDFAINEECAAYDECAAYRPFVQAGKAVLHVEYTEVDPEICALSGGLGLSTIFKDVELGPRLQRC